MPPVLLAIGAAVGAVATGVGIVAGALGAIPVIGGVLNVAVSTFGMALTASSMAIAAGGLAGMTALAGLVSNVALVAGLVGSTPSVTNPGATIQFKADPSAPMPYLMGRCATGGYVVAKLSSSDNKHKYLHNIVALSSCGPHEAIESFALGDTEFTFSSGAAVGDYNGKLWMTSTLGPISGWALTQPSSTGSVPEWTNSHKLTGWAASRLIMKADSEKFAGGSFDSPLWVGSWAKVYDPRLDSTYPGGSGAHRSNDESTWAWSDNPYLNALAWAVGRKQNSILVMGIGVPVSMIDVEAFVDGANIAEENDWTMGGGVTSKDDRFQALVAMLQAGGGVPVRRGGLLSCLVNAPKSPVATIETADIVGSITRSRQQPRADRFNAVSAGYVSEDHKWELVRATAYAVTDYQDVEGVRSREIDYPLVQDATQATQLAAYGIYDTHEIGPIHLSLRPGFAGVQIGEVITASLPEIGIDGDLLILDKTLNPITLSLDLTCRTENADKHTAALGLTGEAPPIPTRTIPDQTTVAAPDEGQWSLSSTSETVGSYSMPVIKFLGSASDNPGADSVIFRWSDGSSPAVLTVIAEVPAMTAGDQNIRVPTPISGGTYYGYVSYRVRGVESASLTLGPVVAGYMTIPGGLGAPEVGDTLLDTYEYGSWSWTANFTGSVTVDVSAGMGNEGDAYDPDPIKHPEYLIEAGDPGIGGYSQDTIAVTDGVTVLNGSIGGDTECVDTGQFCYAGGDSSADEYGAYNGSDGTASGGTTNNTGGSTSTSIYGRITLTRAS